MGSGGSDAQCPYWCPGMAGHEMPGGSITPQQSAFPSHFEDMQSAEKLLLISGPLTPASILETIVIGITQKI